MLFGNFRVYSKIRRAVFQNMGAIQWATLEVSTSWVREMTLMPILFGGIIAECARMTNGNKWKRANVKKCIRDLGILLATSREFPTTESITQEY